MASIQTPTASVHSSRLLALDGSAHLDTYRGSLGPYRISPVTTTIPVMEASRWSPVPVVDQSVTAAGHIPSIVPNVTASHIPNNVSYKQPHRDAELQPYKPFLRSSWVGEIVPPGGITWTKTSTPTQTTALAVQPATSARLPASPTVQIPALTAQTIAAAYNISQPSLPSSSIPPLLRYALDRCNAHPAPASNPNAVYQVIEDTASTYMDGNHNVVGRYSVLREANEAAVQHFIDGGFLTAGLEAPEIEVMEGGRISCGIATDGSMGGYTTVYVRGQGMRMGVGMGR